MLLVWEKPSLGLLCVGFSAACGAWALYRLRGRQVHVEWKVAGVLLLLTALCSCYLPASAGLPLFCGICLLSALCVPLQDMLPVHGKAVLITGCDSGFGHALAKYLDDLGFRVFAGVLNKKGAGAEELRSACSPRLSLLQLDITNSEQTNKAYTEVQSSLQNSGLWGIIHNAGVLGYVGDGELLPLSVYKKCMDVNFFGAVQISKTFFPLLRRAKGRLVTISSMAGHAPLPGFAAYGASKAALSMFSGVMRQELSKWGVKVATIQPGAFRTSIYGPQEKWSDQDEHILGDLAADAKEDYGEDYVKTMKDCYQEMISMSSADLSPVLSDVYHALLAKRPRYLYSPGRSAYIIPCIFHYFPLWIYDVITNKMFEGTKKLPPRALQTHQTHNEKHE
ncbi:17-beta-hydroxysteroid dehydrogenase type 2 [Ambystoma mexicanum]|uniref:17-beta-hydroxysteroid dehydrogenase type 2 n=1 Tax=Ambystoma mexicanum TaxID=8296 RepID=UPI0037E92E39